MGIPRSSTGLPTAVFSTSRRQSSSANRHGPDLQAPVSLRHRSPSLAPARAAFAGDRRTQVSSWRMLSAGGEAFETVGQEIKPAG